MIQDISGHHLYNEFDPNRQVKPDDYIFHFNANGVLVRQTEDGTFLPRFRDLPKAFPMQYLLAVDDHACFMIKASTLTMGSEWTYIGMSDVRRVARLPKFLVYTVVTAFHLSHWYRDNAFCGRCGTETVWAPDERALDCPKCGRRIYPRINPAVIVGVTNGDEILMTKYANRPFKDYALVAGFTEIGESLEQTVRREVMEEVGLKVKNIRYYKSQPWGFADDILMGYFCDVDGDPTIHLDTEELKIGKWFRREDVIGQHDDYSLTNEMMMIFKNGKEPK